MENFTPYSALLGGALIGLSAAILLFNGRIAGISSIMNGMFKSPKNEIHWRSVFLAGLIVGALLFQFIAADFVELRQDYPLWLVAVGGFLVGIGTRLGSGCTSGHGICGIANLSLRSIYATLTFMTSGFITVYLLEYVVEII